MENIRRQQAIKKRGFHTAFFSTQREAALVVDRHINIVHV
jgi:hypothetical protein